jgi:ABC-type uncharacterized transport system auxiliary subunit
MPAVLLLTVLLATPGCLTKRRPPKTTFALQVPALATRQPETGRVLEVRKVLVDPLFTEKALLYRAAEHVYERDPYAAFLTLPDQMFQSAIRAYLRNMGKFRDVVDSGGAIRGDVSLVAEVLALYGDFRGDDPGTAVLALRFVFFESERNGSGRVIYARDFAREMPLSERTPAALVAGWDEALRSIMHELEAEPSLR